MTLREKLVGAVLVLLTILAVTVNQRDVGIARDETVYIRYGDQYASWWTGLFTGKSKLSTKSITATFGGPAPTDNNREHPPLMKYAFGFSAKLFGDSLTAHRFPGALMQGLGVGLVYWFALSLWGFAEAVLAALLLLLLPRALFHAGLACFDAPAMTLWFATIVAYWRCMDGREWPWQVGVVWGLALATKHTALLLPFALGVHYVVVGVRAAGWRGMIQHRWRVIVSLAVLGPLTLFALWPWLWLDPIAHVREWLAFHMHHVHYNFEYLGKNWNAPPFPWHVALVTTLFTVPVVTLGAALLGSFAWLGTWIAPGPEQEDARMPVLLLVLSACAALGPFFLGTTPIFGAEKHWMPALPTIVLAAAVGVVWAARLVMRRYALPALASLVVLAAATETITAQPYALTWYNALAGGAPGGADLGMNRQFWGVAARGVLPVIGSGKVYTHDASPAWDAYKDAGLVHATDAGPEQIGIDNSNVAIVIHELHFNRHDYMIWKSYGTVQPVFVLRSDGVPIVSVYRRPVK
ncbi:MAG TPA: glycosyltransferase family 39 protein [Kofleriaceae bacterium]